MGAPRRVLVAVLLAAAVLVVVGVVVVLTDHRRVVSVGWFGYAPLRAHAPVVPALVWTRRQLAGALVAAAGALLAAAGAGCAVGRRSRAPLPSAPEEPGPGDPGGHGTAAPPTSNR